MTDHGVIVLKFWLQIDKDEQERRFNERMEDPEETEDADSKEDEEEDAPEVLDADETTEDTSSEEAETISQDEE